MIGDSRTGKTIACDAYRLKYASQTASGDAPIVPVILLARDDGDGAAGIVRGAVGAFEISHYERHNF